MAWTLLHSFQAARQVWAFPVCNSGGQSSAPPRTAVCGFYKAGGGALLTLLVFTVPEHVLFAHPPLGLMHFLPTPG